MRCDYAKKPKPVFKSKRFEWRLRIERRYLKQVLSTSFQNLFTKQH